ncbi:MAG TPA: HAD hydrolase-like protein, partial [Anaerolineales bacterium]|nr:HAD hydrolase-like protein [Anaerolineales bacterium]
MIKALIFDFDGLILDTETPEYQTWQTIYREHGFELPHEEWGKIIGGYGISNFDAAEHLVSLTQGRLDSASLRDRHRSESRVLTLRQPIL